ncbi:MAG: FAD-dependent oxidoreductase [Armatimonadetes bacterium]|nr:FAD-dependent oxidoreductase [Armatimonadota bacterium]
MRARLFCDSSGDSILAPLSGADVRIGREAQEEYGEDIEPPVADSRTMGMSCLIQGRELEFPVGYTPPSWATVFASDEDLPHRGHDPLKTNFWWLELGGEDDSIHDTERLRDELLAAAFGVWDHMKNRGDHGLENWTLDWVGFVPGKRESRRYLGDHVLTQNDVRAEGRFDDIVAFGGWSMDDHHPGGLRYPGRPTIFHPAPSPFGIPYRCLYSRNVPNLLCAGRNISASHAAMSSSRVMGTCAVIGQAAGTAAAIAAAHGVEPRGVYEQHLGALQSALMDDDAWLPWRVREVSATTRAATLSTADAEPLRNGVDRPWDGQDNAWVADADGVAEYTWADQQWLERVRLVFDSDLDRTGRNMPACYPRVPSDYRPPACCQRYHPAPAGMVRDARIELRGADGAWQVAAELRDNHQRLVRLPLAAATNGVRLVVERAWGAETARVFGFEVE